MPVFYPFLIAIIPILHLLVSNPGQARFSDAIIPMLISLGFALVAFVALRLILKNWEAAGLIVSLFLVLFYSFGYMVDLSPDVRVAYYTFSAFGIIMAIGIFLLVKFRGRLQQNPKHKTYVVAATLSLVGMTLLVSVVSLVSSERGRLGMHLLLAAFCIILFAGVFLLAKFRDRLRNLSRILNVVAAALMVLILVNLFTSGTPKFVTVGKDEVRRTAESTNVALPDPANLPDIYYIILDGYASNRSLEKFYGFDNSKFTGWLESRGFYVAHESHSNYFMTALSLAASLNMKYINYLSEEVGELSNDRTALSKMTEDNGLVHFLKSRGYKFAFFESNWGGTNKNRNADISVSGGSWLKDEFIVALLKTTALRGVFRQQVEKEGLFTREGVLRAFSMIPRIREEVDGPVFVFAHILPPHPPFLFDRNGNPASGSKGTWGETDRYLDQLMFVNGKTREMVDQILANSEKPPIIIIQADHGPLITNDADFDFPPNPGAEVAEIRTGILNAYYLPGGKEFLYEGISPVNSFKVVLNRLFGTGFKMLDDRSYVSSYEKPYSFKDITGTLDGMK